ncbi:hypothetical protein KC354_g133 [Hortaea werneckii]|nr:hypothetical protein KC354_g133 [Hortaea werneckii]
MARRCSHCLELRVKRGLQISSCYDILLIKDDKATPILLSPMADLRSCLHLWAGRTQLAPSYQHSPCWQCQP